MGAPKITVTPVDGGAGLVQADLGDKQVFIGCCTQGTDYAVVLCRSSALVKSTFKGGPAAECAAPVADLGPVYVIKVPANGGGALTSVTQSGGGPVVTLTGTANDIYLLVVKITLGGARATATFQYSLDGGLTWSAIILTAATYLIPDTGITLNFAVGTYVLAETYSASSTAPTFTATELNAAMTALHAASVQYGLVNICGQAGGADDAAKSSAAATLAAAGSTKIIAGRAIGRFARLINQMPDVADSALVTAFSTFGDATCCNAAGFVDLVSPLTGRTHKRSFGVAIAYLAKRKKLGQSVGRVKSGALPAMFSKLYRDESTAATSLDDARFAVGYTFQDGTPGIFALGKLASPADSDYKELQHAQVIDTACRAVYAQMKLTVGEDFIANDDGTIDEGDARALETLNQSAMAQVIAGECSNFANTINRQDNVYATQKLRASVRVRPFLYTKDVDVDVGISLTLPQAG